MSPLRGSHFPREADFVRRVYHYEGFFTVTTHIWLLGSSAGVISAPGISTMSSMSASVR